MSNLDHQIGSLKFLPLYFTVLTDFSSFLVSFLYELLIPKHWRKATGRFTLVSIGCGLACSMLRCVAAWQAEGKRLKGISNHHGLEDDVSKTIPMSSSWLLPQFVLLGVMEGLAVNGLTDLLADRIANNNDALRATYYASHISDLNLGVGNLITASTIILFMRSWLHHNINGSRLDCFYKAPDPVGGVDFENKQTTVEQEEQEINEDDEEEVHLSGRVDLKNKPQWNRHSRRSMKKSRTSLSGSVDLGNRQSAQQVELLVLTQITSGRNFFRDE